MLLDAVAQVKGRYLWLAGEGPLRRGLERQASSLGIKERVRFLGWRDDAAALLAACDMLVCSSRSEPLGNTIIEAWAARRAVIACAASGPVELIRSGETGLLVPVNDAAKLAASSNPNAGAGQAARPRARRGGPRALRHAIQRGAGGRALSRLPRLGDALMCGIAGMMSLGGDAPPVTRLQAMEKALAHRGPDGNGHYRSGDVGMVQTRLAIIDLATGDQPLYEPGGAALVANAEIYNYRELHAEDAAGAIRHQLGLRAAAASLSQIRPRLPQASARYGRDRAARSGERPPRADARPVRNQAAVLRRDARRLRSSPRRRKLILVSGAVPVELVRQSRNELLELQFTTGRDTIFAGISRVLPGETLVVTRGRIVERRHIEALPRGEPARSVDEEAALAEFDGVFAASVTLHQRYDVPYCMFLSGGTDSTAVLAMMARLNERPVKAFTIGFSNAAVSDEDARRRVPSRMSSAPSMSRSSSAKAISGRSCPRSRARWTIPPRITRSCRPTSSPRPRAKPG